MAHDTRLIATIAAAFVLAFGLGFIASRLRLPPIVGYLLAGTLIGPFTPGFVGDIGLAGQLAEIGVMLLMFGVGLHFSIKDLMAVRKIAVPGAIVQILTAMIIAAAMTSLWGWELSAGLTLGLALSVASTVVLLRALEQHGKLDTQEGRIAIGWLIVEDLAMVLALVLLPAFATMTAGNAPPTGDSAEPQATGPGMVILLTCAKVALFILLALVVGRRVVPWLLRQAVRTGSRELFTLSVLAIAIGVALGSAELFGVSFALGAFFAGVILSETELSHRAAEESLPLQDAFAVLFFVSVGMLFDPSIVLREPAAVLGVILVIMIGKSLAALGIVLLYGYPLGTALTVSAGLAQIGEFSFILVGLGITLELLPAEARDLILAGSIFSIALNPLVFASIPRVVRWCEAHPRLLAVLERKSLVIPEPAASTEGIRDHAVIVGHGLVGRLITPALEKACLPFVVIERDRPRLDALRASGVPAIFGDATIPRVLREAGIDRARLLIVATPDSYQARRVIELARSANPKIVVIVRAHTEREASRLRAEHAGHVVLGERELARTMLMHALWHFDVPADRSSPLLEDPADQQRPSSQ